jgi:hypothetical protein
MNWKYYKRWNDIEEILAAFRRWKREDTEKNMKRIKAACITQTIHFINKDITKSEYSKRKVQEEITRYKTDWTERGQNIKFCRKRLKKTVPYLCKTY